MTDVNLQPAFDQGIETVLVNVIRRRLLRLRIEDRVAVGDRLAVLRPDRVGVAERGREVARDQDYCKVTVLQTVVVLVDVEIVVQELQRAGKSLRVRRVEDVPVLAGNLIEPVVLRVADRLPARALGRLCLRGRSGSADRGSPHQSETKLRNE